jgi:hypothetical protein
MKPSRYQFTLSRMLLSITWIAASLASFGIAFRIRSNPHVADLVALAAVMGLGAGIGQLFGRPIIGAAIGAILAIPIGYIALWIAFSLSPGFP